jgi:hypothetical protein
MELKMNNNYISISFDNLVRENARAKLKQLKKKKDKEERIFNCLRLRLEKTNQEYSKQVRVFQAADRAIANKSIKIIKLREKRKHIIREKDNMKTMIQQLMDNPELLKQIIQKLNV